MRPILLSGKGVRIADVVQVARKDVKVALAPEVERRIAAARAVVDRLTASDTPIYGLNSALGANTGRLIDPAQRTAFQERAVQARAVGVGTPFPAETVRAMLFARIAGMAVGGSGVSPQVLATLIAMLNQGVHPVVPSIGSISAADLAPLSHLGLVAVGQGQAEYRGDVHTGIEALDRAGLVPAALAAKDGLALISSNAATVGAAALVLQDCADMLDALNLAAALTCEGFVANLSPIDRRAQSARPARGQLAMARRLRELLAGSRLFGPGAARRLQDPLSLRCVPQVHGAAFAALLTARDDVELELNSAADSPLVLVGAEADDESEDGPRGEDGEMLSTGNFHIPALAIAFDTLGIALAHTALICVQRCQKLYNPALSGLPLQLTTLGPAHSGFATLQKTLTSLYNQIRHLANPASIDSLPVSEAVEDHAPMASNTVAKTAAMIPLLRYLAAIELLSAAQAIDLRAGSIDGDGDGDGDDDGDCNRQTTAAGVTAQMGQGTAAAYAVVRENVPVLSEDRPLGPDVEAIAALISARAFPLVDLLAR